MMKQIFFLSNNYSKEAKNYELLPIFVRKGNIIIEAQKYSDGILGNSGSYLRQPNLLRWSTPS